MHALLFLAAAMAGFADHPVEVIHSTSTFFPQAATQAGFEEGTATVLVAVDATGRLTDAIATAATHPAFAVVAVKCVHEWAFGPAMRDGRAVAAVRPIQFRFESYGTVLVLETPEEALQLHFAAAEAARYRLRALDIHEVDTPPRPVSQAVPEYPAALRRQGVHGKVEVSYFIDEQGRARVPEVAPGAPEGLAEPVLQAVRTWRFRPATVQGRPVLLSVSQTIAFGRPG